MILNPNIPEESLPAKLPGLPPLFEEHWVAGTYLVSGTFFLAGRDLTPDKIRRLADPLYQEIRQQQKAWWPRGLAGFYVIPIFCGMNFSDEICAWARARHRHRWAIWLEPMLYDTAENTVIFREDYRRYGRLFFPYLSHLLATGLGRASAHFGHAILPEKKRAGEG